MTCPPLHLSGWSRFTPQPLGPFSFDIGAKRQWIYKKQLTESYLWHPFLFFPASAVQEFFAYFYFSFAVMSSDSGSLTQTTLSRFPPPPSSVFLSAWQIATCSLRIIFPSCTFPTLVSKLLKRLMSTGAWIVTLDICHRANAKCMACVQYQKAKSCSVRGKKEMLSLFCVTWLSGDLLLKTQLSHRKSQPSSGWTWSRTESRVSWKLCRDSSMIKEKF